MKRDERAVDAIMIEQRSTVTGIFTGNAIDPFKNLKGMKA
jgi:hypothetical protein